MDLKFEKQIVTARFRNPMKNYEIDEQIIEQRIDPLLKRLSLIPHELKQKASFYYGTPDKRALKKNIEESKTGCFFCAEKLEQATPNFLEEICEDGKIKVGKATAFPNIFPYYPHCGVIVIDSSEHWLPLKEISPNHYGDAIKVGIESIKKAFEFDSSLKYPLIGANFLPAAGSSVLHAHIHAVAGPEQLFMMRLLQEASHKFKEATGKNYWEELIKEEQALGERYIAQTGDIHWFTPFAPLGNNEVLALVQGKSNFLELTDEDITHLGKGIANVLHYYHKKHISGFNFLLYSGALGESNGADSFFVGWQIVSRPSYRAFYLNDYWWLQTLGYGSVIFEFPEVIAENLKEFF